jgi:hypothetical protein
LGVLGGVQVKKKTDRARGGHGAPGVEQHDSHVQLFSRLLEEKAFLERLRALGGATILDEYQAVGWPKWQSVYFFRNWTARKNERPARREHRAAIDRYVRLAVAQIEQAAGLSNSSLLGADPSPAFSMALAQLRGVDAFLQEPPNAPRRDFERYLRLAFAYTTRRNTRAERNPRGDPHDRLGWILQAAIFDQLRSKPPNEDELKTYERRRQEDERESERKDSRLGIFNAESQERQDPGSASAGVPTKNAKNTPDKHL